MIACPLPRFFFFFLFRARQTRFFLHFTTGSAAAPSPTLVSLLLLMTMLIVPVLFPPEPEKALVTLFEELLAVLPKLTVPELLMIFIVPTKVTKASPPARKSGYFYKYEREFMPAWTIV